jgi:hypothetical protein
MTEELEAISQIKSLIHNRPEFSGEVINTIVDFYKSTSRIEREATNNYYYLSAFLMQVIMSRKGFELTKNHYNAIKVCFERIDNDAMCNSFRDFKERFMNENR